MERRLPQFFFALSLLALALMLVAVWQAGTPAWKTYQQRVLSAGSAGRTQRRGQERRADTPPWRSTRSCCPGLQRVDRCTTCHLGVEDPTMKNAPQPFTLSRQPRRRTCPPGSAAPSATAARASPPTRTNAHGKVRVLAGAAAAQGIHPRLLRALPQRRRRSRRAGADRRPPALRNAGLPRLPQAERRGRKHRSRPDRRGREPPARPNGWSGISWTPTPSRAAQPCPISTSPRSRRAR